MACRLADRSNQSYLVRLEATVFGDRLGCRDSLDRLTAGGFVAAWSAKKRAALFARSKRSEGILQNVEVENVWNRGTQEAGAAERGGHGSSNCSLR